MRQHLKEPCMNLVAQACKIIIELADSIKTMTRSTRVNLMKQHLNKAVEELHNCLKSQPQLFIDNKGWQIVEDDPRPNFINVKVTPSCKSENPQALRIRKADGDANKKPVMSSENKIWPLTSDGSVAVRNSEAVQGAAFMDTFSLATAACLLTKVAARLETVIVAVDELGELTNFPFAEEEWRKRPTVHNYNASAKGSPHYPSPSRPQPIQDSAAKVRPPNLSPSRTERIQNSVAVIPAAEQLPRLSVKSVQWSPM